MNAEGAKVSQRAQKIPKKIELVFFCVLCESFAPSAFKIEPAPVFIAGYAVNTPATGLFGTQSLNVGLLNAEGAKDSQSAQKIQKKSAASGVRRRCRSFILPRTPLKPKPKEPIAGVFTAQNAIKIGANDGCKSYFERPDPDSPIPKLAANDGSREEAA